MTQSTKDLAKTLTTETVGALVNLMSGAPSSESTSWENPQPHTLDLPSSPTLVDRSKRSLSETPSPSSSQKPNPKYLRSEPLPPLSNMPKHPQHESSNPKHLPAKNNPLHPHDCKRLPQDEKQDKPTKPHVTLLDRVLEINKKNNNPISKTLSELFPRLAGEFTFLEGIPGNVGHAMIMDILKRTSAQHLKSTEPLLEHFVSGVRVGLGYSFLEQARRIEAQQHAELNAVKETTTIVKDLVKSLTSSVADMKRNMDSTVNQLKSELESLKGLQRAYLRKERSRPAPELTSLKDRFKIRSDRDHDSESDDSRRPSVSTRKVKVQVHRPSKLPAKKSDFSDDDEDWIQDSDKTPLMIRKPKDEDVLNRYGVDPSKYEIFQELKLDNQKALVYLRMGNDIASVTRIKNPPKFLHKSNSSKILYFFSLLQKCHTSHLIYYRDIVDIFNEYTKLIELEGLSPLSAAKAIISQYKMEKEYPEQLMETENVDDDSNEVEGTRHIPEEVYDEVFGK